MLEPEILKIPMSSTEFLQILAASFSAIGTIFAAIVALWLARRSTKPRLKVYVRLIPRMDEIDNDDSDKSLAFFVTNIGGISVTIDAIVWYIGKSKRGKVHGPVFVIKRPLP